MQRLSTPGSRQFLFLHLERVTVYLLAAWTAVTRPSSGAAVSLFPFSYNSGRGQASFTSAPLSSATHHRARAAHMGPQGLCAAIQGCKASEWSLGLAQLHNGPQGKPSTENQKVLRGSLV